MAIFTLTLCPTDEHSKQTLKSIFDTNSILLEIIFYAMEYKYRNIEDTIKSVRQILADCLE